MIFQKQLDLLERKQRLGWTNRECGNAMGCQPSVASSKLNGFTVLTDRERKMLTNAFEEAEHKTLLDSSSLTVKITGRPRG